MSTYKFSLLANNQHLSFNPDVDILNFDSTSITASAVRLVQSGANLGFSYGGKTIWLDATVIGELSFDPVNVTFANGSVLAIGDGTSNTLADFYGQNYTLGSSKPVGNQVWGLGGADIVQTGGGADYLVGNLALTSLNHVSRVGSIGAPTGTHHPTISADGRFVAFVGGWTQFGSTNNKSTDVLVKDMVTGTVSNEHENSAFKNGNSRSGSPVISADGQVLAFHSASSNLVGGSPSGALYDIYVSDVGGSGIKRVSTGTGGTLASDGRSLNPDVSGDGRYVVFESTTSNWANYGSNTTTDIFLKDRVTGTLTRISTSTDGGDGNFDSINAKISADGRFVVFESGTTNLTRDSDFNGTITDIFVWDRNKGSLTNLSSLEPTTTRNRYSSSNAPDIAYDKGYGGVVVFQTAKGLVAQDTGNNIDIYAFNLADNTFKLVSSKADGSGAGGSSEFASVSGDGRFVVFTSTASTLVANDSNGSTADIFVKDLFTGQIALVSKTAAGVAALGPSTHAQISLGGDWIVFQSSATNLASNDGNGKLTDVFRVSNPLLKDTLKGGAGNDTYVLARADVIVENLNAGIDTVQSSISSTLGANLENLVLTGTGNLSGTGNSLNNVITGNAGNNIMNGSTGRDTVSYVTAAGSVTVSLALTTVQNTVGAGSDTITNFENLTGSAYADKLTGNSVANRLDGGLGNDILTGGTGSDTYVVNSNADVIVETGTLATEIDTVVSGVTWTLGARLENLTLSGTAAINGGGNSAANVLTGNLAANTLSGYAGNDTLNGGAGNDTLIGSTGNDTYIVDSAADVIVEAGTATTEIDSVRSSVSWTLGARLENLTLTGTAAINGGGNSAVNVLTGNSSANTLSGYAGNDTLNGGAGNDTLIGSTGSDRLTGGTGADVFVLNSIVGSDTITDFVSGIDDLRISQSALRVGDGDLLVEGALTRAAPGGFSTRAELVVFTSNLASLSAATAAAAIGSATSAYGVGAHALFAVDNGTSSQLYLFTAADANAQVSAGELTLLGTLSGTASTAVGDYLFGA